MEVRYVFLCAIIYWALYLHSPWRVFAPKPSPPASNNIPHEPHLRLATSDNPLRSNPPYAASLNSQRTVRHKCKVLLTILTSVSPRFVDGNGSGLDVCRNKGVSGLVPASTKATRHR